MQGFTKYCAKLLVIFIVFTNTFPAAAASAAPINNPDLTQPALQDQQVVSAEQLPAPVFQSTAPVKALPQSSHKFEVATAIDGLSSHDRSGFSARKRTGVSVHKLLKKDFKADEDITLTLDNPELATYKTKIVDANGKDANLQIYQDDVEGGSQLQIIPTNQFKPGKYTLTVTDETGKSSKQDFTWGVLALNADKAIYQPKQGANFSMAVLDDQGRMVCNAQVDLEIRDVSLGTSETLSTTNGKIRVNPECTSHAFTLKPDYEAHYQLGGVGTYNLRLTAQTANGSRTISEQIRVQSFTPFDIQRTSATRIYPPNEYPMKINVTANRDFKGTITETVPDSFAVTPAGSDKSYDNLKTVYLTGNDPNATLSKQVLGASTGGLVMPFDGKYPITQGFGTMLTDPGLQAFYSHYGLGGHDGIDFGLPIGTPLYAVDDGEIVWSGPGDYGTQVIIQHSWGKTYYGHMSKTIVEKGTDVKRGSQIGYSGMTGEATGPHLHFGMKPNKADMGNGYAGKVDPMPFLPIGAGNTVATALQQAGFPSVLGASTSAEASASATDLTPTVTPAPSTMPVASSTEQSFTVEDAVSQQSAVDQPQSLEKMKVIKWQVNLKKGDKMTLGYNFKTPQISPQFYLMGSLKFYRDGNASSLAFDEGRQWQIAADDVGVAWYHPSSNPNSGYEWRYRKKISVDHNLVGTRTLPTYDTNSTLANDNSTVSSLSWSHTVASQSNRFLLVAVALKSNQTVNSVTYAGASLTKITSTLYNTSARNFEMWYMVAPSTGSNTVTVTLNGTSTNGLSGWSLSYYNVDQERALSNIQNNVGAPAVANATTSTPGVSTNAYFNPYQLVIGGIASVQNASSLFITAGTSRVNNVNTSNSLGFAIADTPGTGGTTAVSWLTLNAVAYATGGIVFGLNGAASTSNISNYPFGIDITDTDLKNRAQTDGDDILFADSTGVKVPHEIESYNSTNGELVAWIKASSLTVNTDNVYYLYYGNPSVASQQDSNNTWNSNMQAVYHLRTTADSTSLNNDGTNLGATSTTGIVDLAANFANVSSQYISVNAVANDVQSGSMSVSLWFKPSATFDSGAGNDHYLFDLGSATSTNDFSIRLDAANGDMKFEVQNSTSNVTVNSTGVTSWTGGNWYYVTATYNSTGGAMNLYVNGLQFGSNSGTTRSNTFSTQAAIGQSYERASKFFNGTIDEVRVTNNTLPIDWAKTDFTNQIYLTLFSLEGTVEETKIYAPTNDMLMRHGKFFDTSGNNYGKQPFVF